MIVYLDTSALLKLYLEEEGSHITRDVVDAAVTACTHLITYAEMCAAFAQAVRMQRITSKQQAQHQLCFASDWDALHILAVDETLVRRAGQLAGDFELRGYDSVHLAAAERIWRQVNGQLQMASFDPRLTQAARSLGIPGIS